MNFTALTDRFARQIEAWNNGHGFSDMEALKDLAVIFHEFINLPERKKASYPGALGPIPLVDVTCGNCSAVRDMLTMCYNWRQHLVNEVTVDFQDVPKAEVEEPEKTETFDIHFVRTKESVRAELTAKGIKFHHKQELQSLIKLLEANG